MGGSLKRVGYGAKDYGAILDDLIAQLKIAYPEQGTDFENPDNSGRMLLEAWAYLTDLMLYYLDRQANESYLPTAQERQNVINLCKLIGYQVAPAAPAQAIVQFSLIEPHESRVVIPAGTALTTPGKNHFELDQDVYISQGSLTGSGAATEGETFVEIISLSSGEAGQTYYLNRSGVISIQSLYVADARWSQSESLATGAAESQIYTVEVDAFARAKIIFGDGHNGAIPEEGNRIEVRYRVGGGRQGNVAAGTIISMPNVARDEKNNRILVNVTNLVAASGGSDAESVDHVRVWAPRFYETQGRLVTDRDYETAANTFFAENTGRLAKSKAIVRERSGEANIVRIYALAYGTDGSVISPSEALKEKFLERIEKTKMFTDTVEMENGRTVLIGIKATIKPYSGFIPAVVIKNCEDTLKNFLDPELRNMGQELRMSDLWRTLDSVDGVDWVEIIEPENTILAASDELIILGDVELTVV